MANDKKWSEFTQQTAFLDADLLAIVRSSTNFTVPASALATYLGVTGTLNVVGVGGSTPILEQPSGTVNNIRSAEDGNGIITSISVTNGLLIAHNFTQDVTDVAIVDDLATASPTFPSLSAGTGVTVVRVGDVITFSAVGGANSLSTNTAGTSVALTTINVPVKIAGTWVQDNSANFTVDGSGKTTYSGANALPAAIDVSVTCDPISGTKDFSIVIAINGSVAATSAVPSTATAGDRQTVSVPWQHTFVNGDFVEVFLENNTDAVDFDVTNAIMRVTG